jgi:hypothetical protein
MKLIKYYILFLFSINIVKAQPVLKKYKFAVWNKNMQDSFESKSYGKEFEFYSFRYLINDTTFYESGVLESDTANKIFFKIINGNWYAERQDDSQEDMLFFDNQNKLSCSVRINNSVYGILWEKNSDSALGKDNPLTPGVSCVPACVSINVPSKSLIAYGDDFLKSIEKDLLA